MKMSDRRLKRILRENPVPVQPKKKEEMLALARTCDEREKNEDLEDGLQMKYMRTHKIRTLILAAVILSLMAVAVTAGIVNYYYRTPGGSIVDQSGTILEKPEGMSLKMTGEAIVTQNGTIAEVNWVNVNGKTTFTVWMTADSAEWTNLRAKIGNDGTEYALKKSFVTKDKDGNPMYVGYTAENFPEPVQPTASDIEQSSLHALKAWEDTHCWVFSEEPFISETIYFEPVDIVPVSTEYKGMELRSYTDNGLIYFGGTDKVFAESELAELILDSSVHPSFIDITDTGGTVHEHCLRGFYGTGSGGSTDTFAALPDGITPVSLYTPHIQITYYLRDKENVTYCDLPIPEPGETLTGEWRVFDVSGITVTITEITRDKYSITCYSPDVPQYMLIYNSAWKETLPFLEPVFENTEFSESINDIQLSHHFCGLEDYDFKVQRSNRETGYEWRIASEKLEEYCSTHDSVRLRFNSFYATYTGGWTLTFPEN